MGRPVKRKDDAKRDPQIIPRYQAMSTWTPKALRGAHNGKRGK